MTDILMKDTLRALCLALIVGILAGAGAATYVPIRQLNALKTSRLIVTDRAGQKRAVLGLDARGKLGLEFFDENGRQRVEVGHLGTARGAGRPPKLPE